MGYIYCIQHKENGRRYIGQTIVPNVQTRWNRHCNKTCTNCTLISRAIQKYGRDKFNWIVLCICFDEDCDNLEVFYIKKYNSQSPNGYNLQAGGAGKHAEETKQKYWKKVHQFSLDGVFIKEWDCIKHAAETLRIGHSCISCVCSSKGRDQISAGGFMWRHATSQPENIEPLPTGTQLRITTRNKGKTLSVETIQKIVIANTGQKRTDVTKEKQRISSTGRRHNDETKDKISNARSRKVVQMTKTGDFLKIWDSMLIAETALGLGHGCISKVCTGKNNTSGGFKWKYALTP